MVCRWKCDAEIGDVETILTNKFLLLENEHWNEKSFLLLLLLLLFLLLLSLNTPNLVVSNQIRCQRLHAKFVWFYADSRNNSDKISIQFFCVQLMTVSHFVRCLPIWNDTFAPDTGTRLQYKHHLPLKSSSIY